MERNPRAIRLELEIKYHDKQYWELNTPEIHDTNYDDLVKELLEFEPDNTYLKTVHEPAVSSTGKITHDIPMLSLDKAYSIPEVLKFCRKVARNRDEQFVIMFKFDGVSGQLKDDILATRGDGLIGEDITHKLPFMTIKTRSMSNDMRGEILFTKEDFQKIKGVVTRKSGADYKNERNAVGGVLTRDDLDPVKILTFIDFEYFVIKHPLHMLEKLRSHDWDKMITLAQTSDYPTDGLVIKVEDEEHAKSLGATSHHLKSAIALKFSNPFQWSVLREIEWSPGKHDITPVGKIDPVEITGVTVVSPSLHNWKNIIDRDLHIGDEVKVERAGDVIPYISDSRPGKERVPIVIPPCPICGYGIVYLEPQIKCVNPICRGKIVNVLADAVIRIGIDRLGIPTIEKMLDTYHIINLMDIFNFTYGDLLRLDRFGETSSKNLFDQIQRVKKEGVYEWQILACLNIPGIGRSLSKQLLDGKSLFEFSQMTMSDLTGIPGIGPERATGIIKGMHDNYSYMHELLAILPIKKELPKQEGLIKVCFTGKFPEKKQFYYDLLTKDGRYEILTKVSGADYLVVADPTKNSTKQKQAEKKGIQILGIDDLVKSLS